MKKINIICLRENERLLEESAIWFSEKWNIPIEAYRESIKECIENKTTIPQWYIILNREKNIIAGAGVIENDFHNRKDLSPNLCALFVKEEYRKQDIARELLNFIKSDLKNLGFDNLYLITELSDFYEKCGWYFFTIVEDEEGNFMKMYSSIKN
ncbi:GNAT family N-acetyltransferase [Aliarcobacter butzleri]|uniref:GNAT family N-acetyltransferase n=1 Tax=Aliarcobacter butzleri TaxID=28197 RepID=UPI000DB2CDAA|nr:GNAT family N-acetyltransferase [Aliarcobacter butzleri]MCG3650778.1 GNAT family N-acetyltransferase [Aliarcobacter butzleri]MDN5085577.1 GNAT family N-acetyltransferase [Aliarcobacter butzleri]MDN5098618.1 GNAT family N-acetyltransferase [Aliarcobacter butzleri]PZP14140.1 MAG: GNAT family N-acetyltransferase [Aliarcobacter butzleri]